MIWCNVIWYDRIYCAIYYIYVIANMISVYDICYVAFDDTIFRAVIWCAIVHYDTLWYNNILYAVIWCVIAQDAMLSCNTIWEDTIWYDMICYDNSIYNVSTNYCILNASSNAMTHYHVTIYEMRWYYSLCDDMVLPCIILCNIKYKFCLLLIILFN